MSDLISRELAIKTMMALETEDIEAYGCSIPEGFDGKRASDALRKIPSAQPKLIRCKDCKWWDKGDDTPFGYCLAMKHGYFSSNWEIGIYRRYKGDFYCADAERKEEDE